MFQLIIEEEDRTLSFPLRSGEFLVGSRPECEIQLGHPTVSANHALIRIEDGRCVVEDLGSRNGTRVKDSSITTATAINPGESIYFGVQEARLEAVEVDDLEAGIEFKHSSSGGLDLTSSPSTPNTASSQIGTATTAALDVFALHYLPRIVDALADRPQDLPAVCGDALFQSLPCTKVRVLSPQGGHLFVATREEIENPFLATVETPQVVLEVGFAHPVQAAAFEPLVRTTSRLFTLGSDAYDGETKRPSPSVIAPPAPSSVEPAMLEIYRKASRIALGSVSVLIRGESGTGKEVLARFLHHASKRSQEPFITLNCAALTHDLLETELFGIESRVATGVDSRPGRFEQADRGTLFLDEIGDMSLATQAKILRVLQEGEFYRVGARTARATDVRILAATNRNLEELIEEGQFRFDLYHRIADWVVELPPLRLRSRDIPNLASHFLQAEGRKKGDLFSGISRAALDQLEGHDWPGNVRQLEREMARAALFLGDRQMLQTKHLGDELKQQARLPTERGSGTLKERLEQVEKQMIADSLERHDGNLSATARELDIARSTLYRRIKDFGLE